MSTNTSSTMPALSWAYIGKGTKAHAFRDPAHTYALCGIGGDKNTLRYEPLLVVQCVTCTRKAKHAATSGTGQ